MLQLRCSGSLGHPPAAAAARAPGSIMTGMLRAAPAPRAQASLAQPGPAASPKPWTWSSGRRTAASCPWRPPGLALPAPASARHPEARKWGPRRNLVPRGLVSSVLPAPRGLEPPEGPPRGWDAGGRAGSWELPPRRWRSRRAYF